MTKPGPFHSVDGWFHSWTRTSEKSASKLPDSVRLPATTMLAACWYAEGKHPSVQHRATVWGMNVWPAHRIGDVLVDFGVCHCRRASIADLDATTRRWELRVLWPWSFNCPVLVDVAVYQVRHASRFEPIHRSRWKGPRDSKARPLRD